MSSKHKPSSVDSLLATIQRTAPTKQDVAEPLEEAVPASDDQQSPRKTARKAVAPRNRVGKPVQFWLHDEDRKLVRELAAWLAGQGMRPTDSMVIRAALRTAKTGGDLLEAYRQAAQLDGRLKHHRDS